MSTRRKALQSKQDVAGLAIGTSPVDVFVLNVEGREWLTFWVKPTSSNITVCQIYGYPNAKDQDYVTLADASADFSTPTKPVEWADGNPYTITADARAGACLRVAGLSKVVVAFTAAGTGTIDGSACAE